MAFHLYLIYGVLFVTASIVDIVWFSLELGKQYSQGEIEKLCTVLTPERLHSHRWEHTTSSRRSGVHIIFWATQKFLNPPKKYGKSCPWFIGVKLVLRVTRVHHMTSRFHKISVEMRYSQTPLQHSQFWCLDSKFGIDIKNGWVLPCLVYHIFSCLLSHQCLLWTQIVRFMTFTSACVYKSTLNNI